MKRIAAAVGLLFALISHQALAAKVFLTVFLDDAPLQGVRVVLDEVPAGVTNERGSADSVISAGDHQMMLTDGEVNFPVSFTSGEDEDVEVSVTFTAAEGDEPRVVVRRFGAGDQGDPGYITGQVVGANGAPLAGATVTARGTDFSTTTGPDGVYVLEVPRGEYALEVTAPGHNPVASGDLRVLAGLGVTAGI
ncbi:MAG: carboxypeptidase-like regulatory domain-containing protein, partial [Halioglobus sp.]